MDRHLNIATLRQTVEPGVDTIIDTDPRVSNWFLPCPDGFTGQWIDDTYSFVEMLPPTQAELAATASQEALEYLDSTDWYSIRQLESGVLVPQSILDKREAARLKVV